LVTEMLEQAKIAEDAGFDGLMTSEHHGGFPGYIPNPLQLAGWILEATRSAWAAPCPLLLPLKHWSHVAEELAWLGCRFPGRVGAGFAIGGLAQDFEMAELAYEEKIERFKHSLPKTVSALTGAADAPLSGDPAIAACTDAPIPMVTAAQSPAGARRAARLGTGILFDSLQSEQRVAELVGVYEEAGGAATRCLIKRVWIGPPPRERIDAQRRLYESYANESAQQHWGGDELVGAEDARVLGERLTALLEASRCNALNLRIHAVGLEPEDARDQIRRVGKELLPSLRVALGSC